MQTFDNKSGSVVKPVVERTVNAEEQDDSNVTYGGAAATILGAGIGSFIFGLLVLLSEASTDFANNVLKISKEVGPLSGKVVYGMSGWLVAWAICFFVMRKRSYNLNVIFIVSLVLLGLGLLMSFPTFFDMFAPK